MVFLLFSREKNRGDENTIVNGTHGRNENGSVNETQVVPHLFFNVLWESEDKYCQKQMRSECDA
jgi:hypothetical protein